MTHLRWIWLLIGLGMFAGANAQDLVQVPSFDKVDGTTVLMPGFWFPVQAASPAPTILLLHGCGGVYNSKGQLALRYRDLAARLNAMGIQALVTDSWTPRNERELCTQRNGQRAVSQLNRRRDALGALQWLASLPGVDATRLGMLGWSNGGSTVLAASNQRHAEVRAAPVKPSLAVAYYPGCESELARGYQASAPLLIMVGEDDDWTPAAPCKTLAEQTSVVPVQIEAYAGAYHGFDGVAPVRLRTEVPNGVRPGHGVHVGGQAEARAASEKTLEHFLRLQWRLH